MRKCLKCNTIVDYSEFNNAQEICKSCLAKLSDRRLDLAIYHIRKDPMTIEEYKELTDLLIAQVNEVRSGKDHYKDNLFKDKLHRRNMQIKDLKAKLACLTPEAQKQVKEYSNR